VAFAYDSYTNPSKNNGGAPCNAYDHVAHALAEKIAPIHKSGEIFPLIATQGTGILSAPVSRLRYDFRRLGRSAASALLNGTRLPVLKPALVSAPSY
jgi:hypothetical protein